jgi:hypothetical protein
MSMIPPKSTSTTQSERTYRTALDASLYLKLEQESLQRGITPYRMSQAITSSYLSGGLLILEELPESIQNAIRKHQKLKDLKDLKQLNDVNAEGGSN